MTNEQLALRIKAGEDVADNMLQLYQQNMGIIKDYARKYRSMAEEEDLQQEAYFAICKAVDSYDPDKGVSFLSWAVYWIRQQMLRYCQNTGIVRIPVHASERVRKYKAFQNSFRIQVGRYPTEREYCYYLGVSEDMLRKIHADEIKADVGSTDITVRGLEDNFTTIGDTVVDPEDKYEDMLDDMAQQELKAILWPMVDGLPGRMPLVIRARFLENLSLKETAARNGITIEAARQQQNKAMRELRRPSRVRYLRPFFEDGYIYNSALHGNGVTGFNRTWTSSTERVALQDC